MSGLWVFGYGSLVSPESFGSTLGRPLEFGVDLFEAELSGFGRRWNYGVMHITGLPVGSVDSPPLTIVALGVVAAPGEVVNGVVGWVEPDEVVALDHRERHYDRVDVSDLVAVEGGLPRAAPIAVYVPRREAVEHYEQARDAGVAAIEQRYWDLVEGAFAALGQQQHQQYRTSTPEPDVPVLEIERCLTPRRGV